MLKLNYLNNDKKKKRDTNLFNFKSYIDHKLSNSREQVLKTETLINKKYP
jgi:hypothetical protein